MHGKKQIPKDRCPWRRAQEGNLVAMALWQFDGQSHPPWWAEILWEEGESSSLHPSLERSRCMCEPSHLPSRLQCRSFGWHRTQETLQMLHLLEFHLLSSNLARVKWITAHRGLWNRCFCWISNRDFIGFNPASGVCSQFSFHYVVPLLEQGLQLASGTTHCNPQNIRKASCCLTPMTTVT